MFQHHLKILLCLAIGNVCPAMFFLLFEQIFSAWIFQILLSMVHMFCLQSDKAPLLHDSDLFSYCSFHPTYRSFTFMENFVVLSNWGGQLVWWCRHLYYLYGLKMLLTLQYLFEEIFHEHNLFYSLKEVLWSIYSPSISPGPERQWAHNPFCTNWYVKWRIQLYRI